MSYYDVKINSLYFLLHIMYNITFLDLIKSYKNYAKFNIEHLKKCRKKYRNYANVMYSILTNHYPVIAKSRSGSETTIHDYFDAYNGIMGINSDPNEDIMYVNDLKFYGGKKQFGLVGIFVRDVYKFLPVNGNVVIDIGASIGDSSIYFASQGAKKVIALEPDARAFELAKKNIAANNFDDKIDLIQAGCTGTNTFHYDSYVLRDSMNLEQILDKCEKTLPKILKLGCLGCEYDVILNTPEEIISKFSHIQVQFHYGYRNIKEKLEKCGYKVRFCGLGEPTFIKNPFEGTRTFKSNGHTYTLNNMIAGSICAIKE